jgi:hypothetical protein
MSQYIHTIGHLEPSFYVIQKFLDAQRIYNQQAVAAATSDYDEAMFQYIHTIGHLEPSYYVIQKFLDALRIYNHMALRLNCHTKLKDVEKLNIFIKSEEGIKEISLASKLQRVCHAANYHEHAVYVAKKAATDELYLKILLEDLGQYDEVLQYISSLKPSQAGVTVKEYGKILIEHKSVKTIEILMKP